MRDRTGVVIVGAWHEIGNPGDTSSVADTVQDACEEIEASLRSRLMTVQGVDATRARQIASAARRPTIAVT